MLSNPGEDLQPHSHLYYPSTAIQHRRPVRPACPPSTRKDCILWPLLGMPTVFRQFWIFLPSWIQYRGLPRGSYDACQRYPVTQR
jgi:hypothetical protein